MNTVGQILFFSQYEIFGKVERERVRDYMWSLLVVPKRPPTKFQKKKRFNSFKNTLHQFFFKIILRKLATKVLFSHELVQIQQTNKIIRFEFS